MWRWVSGFEGLYMVSTEGIIKSCDHVIFNKNIGSGKVMIKGKILKYNLSKKGYPVVYLSKENKKKTFSIHRLVAIAFIENPYNKSQVNHKDGVKTNNHVSNLEWATNSENMKHAIKNGLIKRSVNCGRKKRKVSKYDIYMNHIEDYESQADAFRKNNGLRNIHSVMNGKRFQAGGFIWRYKND